ncbi:hypothetical protein [Thalassoporum mexicanum]|uniref:hypothetical protein n=1 Tax=Thalassoporum mexicanum TaxID=3457544 RepID=UPI0002F97AC0|nr:hypothetical protein [Pseudanabaena sp. PCC 7367]
MAEILSTSGSHTIVSDHPGDFAIAALNIYLSILVVDLTLGLSEFDLTMIKSHYKSCDRMW